MKIACSKNSLLNGINIVSKAVSSKSSVSTLECILIDAANGEITLLGNDTELGIETLVDGEIIEPGIIAIDAKVLQDIVRKLPDNEVVIETDSTLKTVITCEKSKFNIVGKSGEDFPYLPEFDRVDPIVISTFSFKEAIRQTIFSISDNNMNVMMTGELFDIKDNNIRFVSLDGHRVSIRNIELSNPHADTRVVVPGKTLNEILKILPGNASEDVEIYITSNHIIFEFDNTTVVSRILIGEFLRYETLLSSNYETKVTVNKKELLDCLDRAVILVRDGDKKPIVMDVHDDYVNLKMSSYIGSMDDTLDITKTGNDIMIGFNPKFFIDALKVIDEEEVSLYMVNTRVPCFIKDDDGTFTYMILPVNFNGV